MNQNGIHHNSNGFADPFAEAEKPIDIRQMLYKYLLRYWYLYVLGVGIAFTLAFLQLRYATRQYQVTTTVLIKTPESGTSGEGISQEFLLNELGIQSPSNIVQNETHLLKSRTLMLDVVKKLHLDVMYVMEGRIRNGEQYIFSPVLVDTFALGEGRTSLNLELEPKSDQQFLIRRGEKTIPATYGDTIQLDGGTFVFRRNPVTPWDEYKMIIKFRDPEDIAQSYANRINVGVVEEWSSVLQLTLKDPIAEKAADILNTLIEVYNEAAIKDKNRVAENTYHFINERLKDLTDELSGAETEVEQFKTRNLIPSGVEDNVGMVLTEFNANDNELSKLELELNILKNLESSLTAERATNDLLPINLLSGSTELSSEIGKYNDLIQERKRRLVTLTENHPAVQQIGNEIAAARVVILSTMRNTKNNLQGSISSLKNKNNQLQTKLRSIPSVERDLIGIVRQKNIKENLYIYLLQKREEAALSMAVAVSNARVIDAAKPSTQPVEPKPNLYYAIALLLGLGLPLGFVVVKDLLNDTIQTPDDIKQNASVPLLGSIGFSGTKENIVVSTNSRTAIAEMFRMLRTNLQFMNTGESPQVVLVTSGASGEGKTFVTINLGMSMAISGKRTLLISLDLRKPKIGKYLEKEETAKGLTSYLIGEASKEEIIQSAGLHPNLFFIPCGPIPPNPAELILQDRMKELMEYVRTKFDFILIDTPPVGLVSDALLLNEYITGSLFIVRYGETKKGVVSFIDELYKEKKLRRLAVVLNGVKAKGKYGYGSGYGYGYGYYEEEGKKRKKKRTKKKVEE